MSKRNNLPQLVRATLMNCQVCVPADWTDEQVVEFTKTVQPRTEGFIWEVCTHEEHLQGDPVRNPCKEREGFVHITLDA